MGADLSLLGKIQGSGVQYKDGGVVKDPLVIFREHGCDAVRLRLFVNPDGTAGQVNELPYTLLLAKRVKSAGLKFLLDFHYSDGWADPGHQVIPSGWKDLTRTQLVDQVRTYTRDTLLALRREGCLPDMVQVGNEVTNGMMWPMGGPLSDEGKWDVFCELVQAGIQGVRDVDNAKAISVMIHIDKGGDRETSQWFFDHLTRRGVEFDVIGLSYYPFWHGTFADLEANLKFLAGTYQKDIVVVETGYDMGGGDQGKLPFPFTPEGQKSFLEALVRVVKSTPDGRGKGVFYWAPEWIDGKSWGASRGSGDWERRALFGADGEALPALRSFGNSQ